MEPALARLARLLLLTFTLVVASGCAKADRPGRESASVAQAPAPAASSGDVVRTAYAADPPTAVRRVIRTAELSLEAQAPDVTQAKVVALAEAGGGFVISSDTARSRDEDGAENVVVTVVFRVPSGTFDATLDALRALGTRVSNEKVTGQDVTEEYVDLEARIKAQRAVEEQYMAVLKDAKSIPDVLAVQQKLGEVRTEIERAEGRRRYLESQTALSTFTVHLARHVASVDASGPGFGASLQRAGHDAIVVAVAIVNGAIRMVGVLAPVALLIGLPIFLVVRWLVRRHRRTTMAGA